jgi:dUTP pyrophosphatase
MELPVRLTHPNAQLPKKAHAWDAGLDLYAAELRVLFYKNTVGVRTGVEVAIPEGYCGLLTIRSSYGQKGIIIPNAPGIIDSGYRGELIVMLMVLNKNFNYHPVRQGERIAQLVITPIPSVEPKVVEILPPSDGRDKGGFGSSGKL